MLRRVARWRQERRTARRNREDLLVAGLLWHLPDQTGWTVGRRTGLGALAYAVLARMEADGRVESTCANHPPRRRLYRLADRKDSKR